MKNSNEFMEKDFEYNKSNDLNFSKSEEYDDLSISMTYSLNIKSVILNGEKSENTELHSTTFFKIANFKCLNCATDMCYYKSKETEKSNLVIQCNLCGLDEGANCEGFLLCRNCDFHLCSKCRVCSNGHYLKKIYEVNIEKLPLFLKKNLLTPGEMKCNLCNIPCFDSNRKTSSYCPFYICWTCVYLLCNRCMMRTKGISI